MRALRDLQIQFMRRILVTHAEDVPTDILSAGIEPALRLGVYANNSRKSFVESLRQSFPVVLRLVGADYFYQCAVGCRTLFPSTNGDLQYAGSHFPEYLGRLHNADEYRYLSDVARFEWLRQESITSAGCAQWRPDALASQDPATYGELRFLLNPSARLFASEFPCLHIWQANADTGCVPAEIDLREGSDRLVIVRVNGCMSVHRQTVGDYEFLHAVQRGTPLGPALGLAAQIDPEFDSVNALLRGVLAGVIAGFR